VELLRVQEKEKKWSFKLKFFEMIVDPNLCQKKKNNHVSQELIYI